MSIRIAAASSDGKVVNRHFGTASKFLIIDIEKDKYKYVETRLAEPPCEYGGHNDGRLATAAKLISDCNIVLVNKAGPGARVYLDAYGIEIVETGDFITDAISKLQNSKYIMVKYKLN